MAITDTEHAALLKDFERAFHHVQLMRVWVDEDTHEVNVKAHEILLKTQKRIPIKMGLVIGNFMCYERELESLHNAPHTVTGNFSCYNNQLTSLEHGPQAVGQQSMGGGTYSCSDNFLKNFEGAPQDFTGYLVAVKQKGTGLQSVDGLPANARIVDITYQADLPLLKLINQKRVNIRASGIGELLTDITDILNDHAGEGKAGAIKAAAKLIKAGYKGNARW
jgi:hypothetical protein